MTVTAANIPRSYTGCDDTTICTCRCGRQLLVMCAGHVNFDGVDKLAITVHPERGETPNVRGRCFGCGREHLWTDIVLAGFADADRDAVIEQARDAWRRKWEGV